MLAVGNVHIARSVNRHARRRVEFRGERRNPVLHRIEMVSITGKGQRVPRNQNRQPANTRSRDERFTQQVAARVEKLNGADAHAGRLWE